MRKSVSFLLLILFLINYGAYSVRYTLPYFHFYINQENISVNLCQERQKPDSLCKGSCYLKDQLSRTVEGNQKNTSGADQMQFELSIVELYNCQLLIQSPVLVHHYCLYFHNPPPIATISISTPPPNFS